MRLFDSLLSWLSRFSPITHSHHHLKAKTHHTAITTSAKKLSPTLKSLGKSGISNFLLYPAYPTSYSLIPSPISVVAAMVPKHNSAKRSDCPSTWQWPWRGHGGSEGRSSVPQKSVEYVVEQHDFVGGRGLHSVGHRCRRRRKGLG